MGISVMKGQKLEHCRGVPHLRFCTINHTLGHCIRSCSGDSWDTCTRTHAWTHFASHFACTRTLGSCANHSRPLHSCPNRPVRQRREERLRAELRAGGRHGARLRVPHRDQPRTGITEKSTHKPLPRYCIRRGERDSQEKWYHVTVFMLKSTHLSMKRGHSLLFQAKNAISHWVSGTSRACATRKAPHRISTFPSGWVLGCAWVCLSGCERVCTRACMHMRAHMRAYICARWNVPPDSYPTHTRPISTDAPEAQENGGQCWHHQQCNCVHVYGRASMGVQTTQEVWFVVVMRWQVCVCVLCMCVCASVHIRTHTCPHAPTRPRTHSCHLFASGSKTSTTTDWNGRSNMVN